MTAALKLQRMTSDEFIEWSMRQPEGHRYELVGGEVVGMAAERLAHAEVKLEVVVALREAIAKAGLPCRALPDGVSVEIDEDTIYEPDALVRCGARPPGDAVKINDPVIVVEVVSPSSAGRDSGIKLVDYFRLPTLRHYLVVRTDKRSVTHHRRDEGERIETRIVRGGELVLDPPGITVAVERFFP